MATLLLRLAAPLQAWGSSSKFNIRTTEREPTKSGVIGMIAAAMGIKRCDDTGLERLAKLRFGVSVCREGKLIKDYHTAFAGDMSDSERRKTPADALKKYSHTTTRYYLSDAVFIAALETDDTELLQEIEKAVKNPIYPLFLGRRSCPPTLPVFLGIEESELVDTLKNVNNYVNINEDYCRIVYESYTDGSIVQDVPVSFSQLHRKHSYRKKKEEIFYMKSDNETVITEHDPMAEL